MSLPTSAPEVADALRALTHGPWQLGVLIALATLISEDLAAIAAGLLAARGDLSLPAAIVAAAVGIAGGDVLLYVAGAALGGAMLQRRPLRGWIKPEAAVNARALLARWGGPALVGARFVPGLRLPTYVLAGVVRMGLGRFTLWIVVGAALWTPLLVSASAGAGRAFAGFELTGWRLFAAAALVVATLWLVRVWLLPLFTWRGRRLALGRWRRLTRWEFWPIWAFNAPVVAHFLWLALCHRSLTVFTAANPAIPSGGLVRESKSQILEALSAADREGAVAGFTRLPAGAPVAERETMVRAFLAAHALGFPVVLKPDVGQRGEGVQIVRESAALTAALESQTRESIAQEYIAGFECGVFYVRPPGAERGRLFSLTRKRLPAVVGDGTATLERLILADERAVCMAPLHLARHADRLEWVPAAGARVELVELGNHCRGAVFLDGSDLASAELEAAIEALSSGYRGFHFGRFDVRAESEAALRAGRFRVLELNGVASEATHIYDPRTPLLAAYRVLFEQWRLCFAIGGANVAAGHRPTPLGELLREVLTFLRE